MSTYKFWSNRIWSDKFFRLRLQFAKTQKELVDIVEGQNNEAEALIKEIAQMVVYSEAISYTEAWNMTFIERKIFMDVLTEYSEARAGKKAIEQL